MHPHRVQLQRAGAAAGSVVVLCSSPGQPHLSGFRGVLCLARRCDSRWLLLLAGDSTFHSRGGGGSISGSVRQMISLGLSSASFSTRAEPGVCLEPMQLTPVPKVKSLMVCSGVLTARPATATFSPLDCRFRLCKDTCWLPAVPCASQEADKVPPMLLLPCLLMSSNAFLAEFRMASVVRDAALRGTTGCFRASKLEGPEGPEGVLGPGVD